MEVWEEELEKLVDLTSEEISGKLGISTEAADHVHDAVVDYLDSADEEEEPQEMEEGG